MRRLFFLSLLTLTLLAACGADPTPAPPQPDVVATSVAAALTALPQAAPPTPYPTYTPYPTADLSGLFCEYQFCLGHPANFPLFDLEVVNNYTTNRSDYSQGNLIGFNDQLYIFVVWNQFSGQFDPNVALTIVLGEDLPGRTIISEDMNGRAVTYLTLESTPSEVVPFGLAAVWKCGDRWFGWKVYSMNDGQVLDLLWEAVSRFTCRG